MDIPGIRCLTCIHIKVCSLKPTLLMYEMMAKEMGISLHCPNYIDISRLRPEKGQKDDASRKLYVCDRKRCGDRCHYPDCRHTTDISHALNAPTFPNGFEKVEHNGNVYFVERED